MIDDNESGRVRHGSTDVEVAADSHGRKASDGWWRWPLIPIAAPAAAAGGYILFGTFQWIAMKIIGGPPKDGVYYLYVPELINHGVFGFLWCSTAVFMAPFGKRMTTVVMAAVLAAIGIGLIVDHFAEPERYSTQPWVMILTVVAWLIGSITAMADVADEESRPAAKPSKRTWLPVAAQPAAE